MHEWVAVVERLGRVRKAREEFLMRSIVDRLLIGPMLLDRLAADLLGGTRRNLQRPRTSPDEQN